MIWSKNDKSRPWLRWLAPILFITAGLLLAAWSDSEIWPRGDLSWSWLFHHDAEARQHKLYALLLIVFGLVECVQSTPRLRKPWLNMVFPVLCVIGGASLFSHHHSGMAVVNANGMDHSAHHISAAQDINGNCQSVAETAAVNPQEHHHGAAEHGAAATRRYSTYQSLRAHTRSGREFSDCAGSRSRPHGDRCKYPKAACVVCDCRFLCWAIQISARCCPPSRSSAVLFMGQQRDCARNIAPYIRRVTLPAR